MGDDPKPETIEEWAKLARHTYWASLGDTARAAQEPSADSLTAWIEVVDTLDRLS
jgi:hypothetical protein